MAETPVRDEMGYEAMAQNALRGVVRAALERAAMPEGLPGEHHFYITFRPGRRACPSRPTCPKSTRTRSPW